MTKSYEEDLLSIAKRMKEIATKHCKDLTMLQFDLEAVLEESLDSSDMGKAFERINCYITVDSECQRVWFDDKSYWSKKDSKFIGSFKPFERVINLLELYGWKNP